MAFDFILRNARLADGSSVDIAVADGRITAVGSRLAGNGESIDAGSRFVSPGLVESHFHLDKARILDRCAPPSDRKSTDHMKRTAAAKHTFTEEDVYARGGCWSAVERGHAHADPRRSRPNVELRATRRSSARQGLRLAIDLEQACSCRRDGRTWKAPKRTSSKREAGATVVEPRLRHAVRPSAASSRRKGIDVDVDIHLDGGYRPTTDIFRSWISPTSWAGRSRGDRPRLEFTVPAAGGPGWAGGSPAPVSVSVLPATDMFNVGRHMEPASSAGSPTRTR
jgi:cytosine deaminase